MNNLVVFKKSVYEKNKKRGNFEKGIIKKLKNIKTMKTMKSKGITQVKTLKHLSNCAKESSINEQIKEIFLNYASSLSEEEIISLMLEFLMKAERSCFNKERGDVSNGYRIRTKVKFNGNLLQLRIPRTRKFKFYPYLLEILKIQEREIADLSVLLYSKGLTDKDISEVLESIYGQKYSTSRISQMVSSIKEELRQWRERSLESYYPIVYIDAVFLSTRTETNQVKDSPFYIVLAVKTDGRREVLAVDYLPTETSEGWQEILRNLKERGLQQIGLVVSDALVGIEKSVAKIFPNTPHQFCVVHLKRRINSFVASKYKKQIAEELSEVFQTDNSEDNSEKGWQRWKKFIDKWQSKYKRFQNMLDVRYRHYFVYLDYDVKIRPMIYTTNWIERLNRVIKTRFKARYPMPSVNSTIDLITLVVWDFEKYKYPISSLFAENQKFFWKNKKILNLHSNFF